MATDRTLRDYYPRKRSPLRRSKKGKEVLKTEIKEERVTEEQRSRVEDADYKLLRAFDHDPVYGPAVGITRLKRYERAVKLGENPDPMIRAVIERHGNDPRYTESVWYEASKGYKTL